jgi:hypothetical protein
MLVVKFWLHLPRAELKRRLNRKGSGWRFEQRDRGGSRPHLTYLATVPRSIPVRRAIAERERPCR